MSEIIIILLLCVHAIYTLDYSIKFYKTDKFYSKRQKLVHLMLIWLIPFLWIMLLKAIATPTLGSSHHDKHDREENTGFFESGKGL